MKLTPEQVQAALAGLYVLRDSGPVNPGLGICFNLDKVVVQGAKPFSTYDLVSYLSVKWPGLTGVIQYDHEDLPYCSYPILREWQVPLWEGMQRERRLSLLAYLISVLEAWEVQP